MVLLLITVIYITQIFQKYNVLNGIVVNNYDGILLKDN